MIKGVINGAVAIVLAAPPVDGKANEELIRFIASRLDIPKSHISILYGERGKKKLLFIGGADKSKVLRAMGLTL